MWHQHVAWRMRRAGVYLLYLFGPLRGVTECHEYTVGQNGTHDDHAEQREERQRVKENLGDTRFSHTQDTSTGVHMTGAQVRVHCQHAEFAWDAQ